MAPQITDETRAIVAAEREAQGLPPTCTDPELLQRAAVILQPRDPARPTAKRGAA